MHRQPPEDDADQSPPETLEDPYVASILRELHPLHHAYSLVLDERGYMILDCLLMGMTYAQIAQQLFMSVDTVRTGVRKLYATLGCDETTLLSVCKNAGWHRPY
ncbi:MAG: Bacterial regulatory protein luxR family [Chloroflexota bacterium]